jgi:hypothetical protein
VSLVGGLEKKRIILNEKKGRNIQKPGQKGTKGRLSICDESESPYNP